MLEHEDGSAVALLDAEESQPWIEDSDENRPSERIMGARSAEVATKIIIRLGVHVEERNLGKVFCSSCGYQLVGDSVKVRYPDGSFVARGRLPNDSTPKGHLAFAPDLALEVVSPHNTADEMEEQRALYLKAGVRLLWIAYPSTRTIYVFRPNGSVTLLGEADTLSGEDVLPDFSCPVARLFESL